MIEKNLLVDNSVLFFAFRYALGRMSYAPSLVIDNIKYNIKSISTADIEDYITEIKNCEKYGNECDEHDWLNFLEYLEQELEIRTKGYKREYCCSNCGLIWFDDCSIVNRRKCPECGNTVAESPIFECDTTSWFYAHDSVVQVLKEKDKKIHYHKEHPWHNRNTEDKNERV